MNTRVNLINNIYNEYNEDTRLIKSRQGQLEYMTTMKYIHDYLTNSSNVIEIGAGTGRYSISLAKEGYNVTAVELVENNLNVLKEHSSGLTNIVSYQGDALDLSRFNDNSFDVTLVFGPMYHLYTNEDYNKSIDEAIRITKKDGIIMFAFLSVYAIMQTNYMCKGFKEGYIQNFKDEKNVHNEEQVFTGFDINEFEQLFINKNVKELKMVGVDSILEAIEPRNDFELNDSDFDTLYKYHLHTCEVRELLGASSHLLYICKKR